MGFEQALQTAIYEALTAYNEATLSLDFVGQVYTIGSAERQIALDDLGNLITGVYDNVPQPDDGGAGAAFPYLVIGEGTFNEWDTDTEVGTDASIVIHSWSRYLGRKETQQIQAAIYAALHRATLLIAGYAFVACDWVSSDTFVDADGLTRHGVQTFRILLDEA